MPEFNFLEWDSSFFGYKVGKINRNNISTPDLSKILNEMTELKYKLVYYSSQTELIDYNLFNCKSVDIKVTFLKDIINPIKTDFIETYSEFVPTDELINLAIESGIYSRFNLDENIGRNKYEELYTLWMINSANKKIAKDILIYKHKNIIAGMVTLGEKNKRADIGIIAVNKDFRGVGIGKSLMFASEYWAKENNYDKIQVVTQFENKPACKLYESCGYTLGKKEYFYHFWL